MRQKRAQIRAVHSFHDVDEYASVTPHTSSGTTLEIFDR